MAFPPVPPTSKNYLNRAGEVISKRVPSTKQEYLEALSLVDAWRAAHAYPINTFRATLTRKVQAGSYESPIIAQRLKRLPTIIDKLHRYPEMNLARMQDIGGVRVILKTPGDVYQLVEEYKGTKFGHELVSGTIRDYIQDPRAEDGYRSIHLVYKYHGQRKSAKQYNGLRVELQMRTRLQHSWATAVETMSTMLGQALKSRQGEKEWLNFFALVSSAFAHIEKTPLVPGYEHMTKEETFRAVASAAEELRVLERMRSYASALHFIDGQENKAKWSYHLISLDMKKHSVSISSYGRDDLNKATADYAALEKRAEEGEKLDSVLVSAGPVSQLRRAYPNYFLDVDDFMSKIERIVRDVKR